MRTVYTYLEKTGKKCLRNLYIHMDNASVNKSFTLIAAMGALSLMGIVRKVKMSYLKRGHSHTFGDGVIGSIGSQLIQGNMVSFTSFRAAVIKAFNKKGTGYCDVVSLIGITDYKTMFDDIRRNPHMIHGKKLLVYSNHY